MKFSTAVITSALLILYGCGGDSGPTVELAPVKGVVMLGGSPVVNPVVTFFPESGPAGVGVGNEQGEFTIKTNGRNGCPIGPCKVTVMGAQGADEIPEMDGNEAETAKKPRINSKYSSVGTTDLIIDVTADGNPNLQLDLDSQ